MEKIKIESLVEGRLEKRSEGEGIAGFTLGKQHLSRKVMGRFVQKGHFFAVGGKHGHLLDRLVFGLSGVGTMFFKDPGL
jgi:hypothetical protein